MPLNIVDVDWLNKFSEKREDILNEYKQSKNKIVTFNPIMHPMWHLIEVNSNLKYLPTLKSLLNDLPEDIFLSLSTISIINPGMVGMMHSEPYPRELGFRRYHIVLQTEPTARFDIEGEDSVVWENGKIYEFINPETQHRIYYPEGNGDRIMLMLDVFVNGQPTEETLKMTHAIAEGFIDRSSN